MRKIDTLVADFSREVYTDREPSSSEKVIDFLASYDVAIEDVRTIPSNERPAYLINRLLTPADIRNYKDRCQDDTPISTDVGLIVVKPEMHPHIADLQTYMDSIGLEAKILPTVNISKDEWLSMYGYKVLDSPDIINLYITQRALGMTPIIFRHLPTQFYTDYAAHFDVDVRTVAEKGDVTELFDEVFCGSSDQTTSGTFRWDVVRKSLQESVFHEFTGDSSAFDLCNFYREGHEEYVYKVFNGVHLPSNGGELQRNLEVFLK